MAKSYDIAVLGATAAGYVAAIALAKKGRKVLVLSSEGSPTESPLADWIPADVFPICPALRSVKSASMDGAFRQVQFHSADLDQHAVYRSRSTAGFVLRSAGLLAALSKAARRAGVAQAKLTGDADLELQEGAVVAHAARAARASVLLVAQNRPAEVFAKLAIPARVVPTGQMTICGLDVPARRGKLDNALHVVAWPGEQRLGMFFAAGGVIHVRIISTVGADPGGGAKARQPEPGKQLVEALGELISTLQSGRLLPQRLNLAKSSAAIWRPPGGVALELETHLTKRTLLVGTAGGFASAMTGQTLDPSVRSALVAAEVVDKALKGDRLQESLSAYKRKWRNELANRIRPPGTSLKMLLPIVFSNKAMAERFGRAFLYGEKL